MTFTITVDREIEWARRLLEVDALTRRAPVDSQRIARTVYGVASRATGGLDQLACATFEKRRAERFAAFVEPHLQPVADVTFTMGTPDSRRRHFCGECPEHDVTLSGFSIARVAVTNELFALFDPRRSDMPLRERRKPVANVTWIEATVFAWWMGCRLPTEAEWEFACAGGSAAEWCCDSLGDLLRHAWYSESSGGELQDVGTLEPNSLGLHDLHGNIWEWCADTYDAGFYVVSPRTDPINGDAAPFGRVGGRRHKVCRGGSMHALAEMCRTRYRFHEPADFWAGDLGLRLAAGPSSASAERSRA